MNRYDSSWDEGNEEAWDKIYDKWEDRDWESWLTNNLSFPFLAIRREDERDFRPDYNNKDPFTIDHTFKVEGIELEDDWYGFIAQVKEGRRKGYVPLCDIEVTSKDNTNYWPVREYVVWFANR